MTEVLLRPKGPIDSIPAAGRRKITKSQVPSASFVDGRSLGTAMHVRALLVTGRLVVSDTRTPGRKLAGTMTLRQWAQLPTLPVPRATWTKAITQTCSNT
jgi:hypothetical protein